MRWLSGDGIRWEIEAARCCVIEKGKRMRDGKSECEGGRMLRWACWHSTSPREEKLSVWLEFYAFRAKANGKTYLILSYLMRLE